MTSCPEWWSGSFAANFATPICSNLIELANALTLALTGNGIAADGSFEQMQRVVTGALTNPANAFLTVIIGLVIAVLTALLLVVWLIRLGVLVVLVGIAPVALACHALPYTDAAARMWWRALLGVLGTVLLQALAMHTTLSIFLDPTANVASLGLPTDPTGTLDLFIVACLLWVTVKIPGLIRRYVMRGGQHSAAGMFLKMILVQQLSRLIRIPWGHRGRVPPTGGGRRAAATAGGDAPVANTAIGYWRPRTASPRPARMPATPRSGGSTPTPAGQPAGGSTGSPSRPRVPAATTPATAMPLRQPAWRSSRTHQPTGIGWPDPPPTRSTLPAGARPSGTGWVGGRTPLKANDPRYPRPGERGGR